MILNLKIKISAVVFTTALAIFSTGTYAGIGTMCVESETCYEKYQEEKKYLHLNLT